MIKYVVGDVRDISRSSDIVFIPHCCNDANIMGAGVAKSLCTKWPKVKQKYHLSSMELGSVSYVICDKSIIICNMIGQHGIRSNDYKSPIRYSALCIAMLNVADKIKMMDDRAEIHCPLFGCGLAGGDWNIISILVEEIWCTICPVTCVIHPSNLSEYNHLLKD